MSDSISENGPEVKTKISLKTDNQGRELMAAQQEYFKDSKVRLLALLLLKTKYKMADLREVLKHGDRISGKLPPHGKRDFHG